MKQLSILIFFVFFASSVSIAQDALRQGFETPPTSAKARTWWHWMNGNVSRSGITADLEAMKAVGIQEAQIFNVKLDLPPGEAEYLSPEWLSLFKFAATEAERLGLELAFHNGAGWSSSGGPWMTPEHAMQTVVYSEVTLKGGEPFSGKLPQPPSRLDYYQDIAVMAFPKPTSDVRVDDLDVKNLSGRVRNHLLPDTKTVPATAVIKSTDIIDLTARVSGDGLLEWEVPKGDWVVLRLGHTPIGTKNHPAGEGGHGLECDKMSKRAVDAFWAGGIQPIIDELDTLIGSVVNNCLIDSYEVGSANWTPGFDQSFSQLRGYECTTFLPTLAGYYVDGGEVTERFLWDFRRTVGDLMAENYYAYFGELCHKNGMKFSVEPYWGPFDNMQVGATGDIVMCEFWSGGFPFFDSPKFVSSIAHLNGSSIVGAEAFTGIGGWTEHPATVKSIGDQAWAQGINRFIFHSYVHQPWDVAPGLTLSVYGSNFNRLNTWWEQGKGFMDYIGRSQFLLQQGKSVADVLVFAGESSPNNALLMPELKTMGYDYDLTGVNKLLTLTVKDGYLRTSAGGSYKVLVLPKTDWMRPETLKKLEELANAGATILGHQVVKSPSLKGYPACDQEVRELAEELWSTQLISNGSVLTWLKEQNIAPDFRVERGDDTDISFLHRFVDEADVYFVANARKTNRDELCRFRVSGKRPELWNAETGEIKHLAEWRENDDGTTSVPISFGTEEAVFIVFREPSTLAEHIVSSSTLLDKPKPQPLSGLKIIKAEYGSFLQEGLVDITSLIREKVKNGKLNIQATRQLCDCDPAMGYKKEFRMEYEIGGTVQQVYVMEKELVNLDAGAEGELKIRKAVFGKFKPETKGVPKYYPNVDVTDKIKEMVASGTSDILVSDRLIGGQAVAGNRTSLRISYLTDGEERTLLVPEGKVLRLSKDVPGAELAMAEGQITWTTPYPGKVTVSTTSGKTKTMSVPSVPKPVVLAGSWDVVFPQTNKAPEVAAFEELVSWSTSTNNDIRHFSGTASYRKQFILPANLLLPDRSLELDLGSVRVFAEVIVNGKSLGVLWKAPFRLKLDGFVNEGVNTLEVKITNLWPNRLIGDEAMPLDYERKRKTIAEWPAWLTEQTERPSGRTTFASWKHWDKDAPLQLSGLLGPVVIRPYLSIKAD